MEQLNFLKCSHPRCKSLYQLPVFAGPGDKPDFCPTCNSKLEAISKEEFLELGSGGDFRRKAIISTKRRRV